VREFGEDLACGTLAAVGMFAHTAILISDYVEVDLISCSMFLAMFLSYERLDHGVI